ncbi:MAG: Asp23/Gls24 family envelope stress response protein [Candidatus Omnitrophota bacterium]
MRGEKSQSDLGTIKIHKNVIASIASLAALEIEGVQGIGTDFKSGILELIGRKTTAVIKVEIDKNGDVRLEIPLVIKYGFNIPDISDKVQENVRNALERMTNLTIKEININIQSVTAEKCISD